MFHNPLIPVVVIRMSVTGLYPALAASSGCQHMGHKAFSGSRVLGELGILPKCVARFGLIAHKNMKPTPACPNDGGSRQNVHCLSVDGSA